MSKFIGIGVGPGDPELLTLKALSAIKTLDLLLVPSGRKGGKSEALEIASPHLPKDIDTQTRHFPMTLDLEHMYGEIAPIADEVKAWVNSGKTVGFLTLGDPMLYSTYIYLLKSLQGSIPIETIPGITSFGAIAAGYNRPLVDGDASLVICPCTQPIEAIEKTIVENEAVVLMKLYKNASAVVALLKKHGLEKHVIVVSNYGKANAVFHDHLDRLSDDSLSYFTTLLLNKRW